ncbi:threonine/homoserine exporter RhtA [Cronobacter turicensis]|uniref:Inner membrane transporter rhtA n=1 Tax=Cronobacter turicensis (strain DSM 18703 / CCUG 55852 / LMG 23827 / z3032) TaxID=693216 RepID=C9XZW7_CROTZ|nr:threonine/homoserine exporter RhtA [Cronobacter turicensis]CBA29436.1 Inner membrane transporter rhtA [Cronobacter turicensis z3032]ELQ6019767.1 threonine/homoserine exporter RhtA [Cronobacter turicensis]ELQ6076735.1 threonine/homoserine exporter RhtA [Cronobacter turicensis]ELQ6182422.1 threonine/homoserine exporter RhtA [Cronobacter turicensis]ELQ6232242.1 threonine/homoserine exporter RhtA [Cronobacter turicensis]
MPTLPHKTPIWLPVVVLIVAMASIQSGASLAKSLFPLVGAPGVTALRLALGTLILAVVFKPWRLRFTRSQRMPLLVYGLALGAMNYLFYLSIRTVPLGIAVALEFTGPLAVALFGSRRPVDFLWVALAVLGLWFLLPLGQDVTHVDPLGAACALGAGVCWAIYIIAGQKAGAEHGPATVAIGSLIAAVVFVPIGAVAAGEALWHWSVLPVGLGIAILSTALPYSLEMTALTRLPTRTFGTLMSMEPALAAFTGMIFLGETLTLVQWLALLSIIIASVGSTLTLRRETQIKSLDID